MMLAEGAREVISDHETKTVRNLVVNASRSLFRIKEKYLVIVVYSLLFFAMLPRCITYGWTNSSGMEVKKSWHRLPLQNK